MNPNTLGVTINLPSGAFFVHSTLTLGDVLIGSLLLTILVVMVMRWVYDAFF